MTDSTLANMAEPSSKEINDLLERSIFGIQSATAATSAPGEAGDVFERVRLVMPAVAYVSLLRISYVRSLYVFCNFCALFQNQHPPCTLSSNGKGCGVGDNLAPV